jgi:hypothetical protein
MLLLLSTDRHGSHPLTKLLLLLLLLLLRRGWLLKMLSWRGRKSCRGGWMLTRGWGESMMTSGWRRRKTLLTRRRRKAAHGI